MDEIVEGSRGYGQMALLLAIYPVLVIGAAAAALACAVAVWRSRRQQTPLWFVFAGIVITMMTLAVENSVYLALRLVGDHQAWISSVPWMASIKLSHTIGAGFHFWGAVLALMYMARGVFLVAIIGATTFILGAYIGMVWALW